MSAAAFFIVTDNAMRQRALNGAAVLSTFAEVVAAPAGARIQIIQYATGESAAPAIIAARALIARGVFEEAK